MCNKCEVTYPDTNLFCKKCHSLLQLQKVVRDNSKPKKNVEEATSRSQKKKNNIDKPISRGIDVSENPIYDDWEPPAPNTVYSKMKNIPYGVLKYNLSKGLYTNGIRQIESNINKRTYSCNRCSYYTNFDSEVCTLKKTRVIAKAVCKSFELKPDLWDNIDSTTEQRRQNAEKNDKEEKPKKRKKAPKKFKCEICDKMFSSQNGVNCHQTAMH